MLSSWIDDGDEGGSSAGGSLSVFIHNDEITHLNFDVAEKHIRNEKLLKFVFLRVPFSFPAGETDEQWLHCFDYDFTVSLWKIFLCLSA